MLEIAGDDTVDEKEIKGQAMALTHCVQKGLSFGGTAVRTISVTAS